MPLPYLVSFLSQSLIELTGLGFPSTGLTGVSHYVWCLHWDTSVTMAVTHIYAWPYLLGRVKLCGW